MLKRRKGVGGVTVYNQNIYVQCAIQGFYINKLKKQQLKNKEFEEEVSCHVTLKLFEEYHYKSFYINVFDEFLLFY